MTLSHRPLPLKKWLWILGIWQGFLSYTIYVNSLHPFPSTKPTREVMESWTKVMDLMDRSEALEEAQILDAQDEYIRSLELRIPQENITRL